MTMPWPSRYAAAAQGARCVIHLAALPSVPRSIQDPLTINAVSVGGTQSVVLAVRGVSGDDRDEAGDACRATAGVAHVDGEESVGGRGFSAHPRRSCPAR